MDGFQFIASLVSSLALPVVSLVLALVFRHELSELIGRLRTVKALGAEGTFDPKEVEASVALATATATAGVQVAQAQASITKTEAITLPSDRQLTDRFADHALRSPNAAVLEAYSEVERALKRRMTEAKVADVEKLFGRKLIEVALRKGVINSQTAEALRGISVLRNVAAHSTDEVTLEKALEYLALADAVVYSIEVGRVFATTAVGTGTAFDATVRTDERKP